MLDVTHILLLVFLILASYIQASTGFAFALVVMSGVTAFDLAPIEVTAFVVSFLSLVNSSIGLQGRLWRKVDKLALGYLLIPCVPATFLGVYLLAYFGESQLALLKLILGCCILISSLAMLIKVSEKTSKTSKFGYLLSGLISGVMGGMFAAFGPPMTYIMYRQNISLETIRATLLMAFTFTSVIRLAFVISSQEVSEQAYLLSAVGVPVVILATLAVGYFPLPFSSKRMKQFVYFILFASGFSLIIQAL
ncbi:hypothetical protein TW85_10395 [Marinomonas sp. S3726]|uniref:sulfite exporter TauE/SafE family protein n=1 Tax=Marinomonas sp. S3726 TaxID=579484 RepID=UPI0005F9B9A6|nr:sulfite exporter TauE/SafE family protein [Marinomonas sp. S3726]KJZ14301.1 hypothetical protein TW85_10395 [Marinomonas sp. S3726]